MPIARIEVRRSRSAEEVEAFIEAVYQAQREALKVPEVDRQIRYAEHRPEHFAIPAEKSDNYTYVEINIFPGRSLDAKRKLYASIVRRFAALGVAAEDILIVLHEPPLDNWGLRGKPASEVDLGFSLDV